MKERAKELRRNMSDAENRMGYYLRNRRLGGYKFVRELLIGHYIADFVCREQKLVIEIDGGQHMHALGLGYRVFRIWNNEVFKNIQGVMDSILNLLDSVPHKTPSSPTLLPQGRREQIVLTD